MCNFQYGTLCLETSTIMSLKSCTCVEELILRAWVEEAGMNVYFRAAIFVWQGGSKVCFFFFYASFSVQGWYENQGTLRGAPKLPWTILREDWGGVWEENLVVGITTTTIEDISTQQQVHIASKHSTTPPLLLRRGGGHQVWQTSSKNWNFYFEDNSSQPQSCIEFLPASAAAEPYFLWLP